MQIRTPKKYRGVQRRGIVSCRRLSFYIVMLALIGIGIGIILNRQVFIPIVREAFDGVRAELENRAATMAAPAPTPTEDPRNKLIEASGYWQGGALGAATELYIEIAPSMPNTVEVYRRIALGLINASRYEEAQSFAERAINADPFDAEAWAIRAWALDWQGRATEALSYAFRALELDPENSRAQAYLAEIYFSLDQAERGEALLADLLAADPESPEGYRARGLIRQEYRYDFDGALEDYHQAYGLADNMNFIAVDIARVESGLRNFEAALEMLQEVVDADPYNARALFRLGEIQFSSLGNYAQAQRHLQDCVDFNPDYLYCFFLLGRAQEKLGALEDASVSFEMAIELGSDSAQHHYWAGYAQILLGNCSRALDYLEPGLQLAAQSPTQLYLEDIETVVLLCDPTYVRAAADA